MNLSPIYYLLLLLVFSTNVHSSCEGKKNEVSLAVGATGKDQFGWVPYVYRNEQGQLTGQDVELLRRILAKMNYQLKTARINLPESRIRFDLSCEFDYNTLLGVTYKPSRAIHYYFSSPYRNEESYAHVLRTSKFKDGGALKLIKKGAIGVANMNGYYGDRFERMKQKYRGKQLLHIDGAERRVSMLLKKRVDFLIGDRVHIKTLSQKMGDTELITVGEPMISTQVHFAFAKAHFDQVFVTKFNQTLKATLNK